MLRATTSICDKSNEEESMWMQLFENRCNGGKFDF